MFPRRRSVLAIGKNVTELTVGETVNTGCITDGEVTPDIGATPEIQLVHHTRGRLEALSGSSDVIRQAVVWPFGVGRRWV